MFFFFVFFFTFSAKGIRQIWREVIKFHYLFCHRIFKLYKRMEDERLKLYKDKGASSLRNDSHFHLFVNSSGRSKQLDRTIVQRFRKLSNAISELGTTYNRHYDSNSGDEGPSGLQPRHKKSSLKTAFHKNPYTLAKHVEISTVAEELDSSSACLGYSVNGSFYERSRQIDEDIRRLENGELSDESEIDDNSYVYRSSSSSAGSQGDGEMSSDDEE